MLTRLKGRRGGGGGWKVGRVGGGGGKNGCWGGIVGSGGCGGGCFEKMMVEKAMMVVVKDYYCYY